MDNAKPSFANLLKKQAQVSESLAKDLLELKNLRKETKALIQNVKSSRTQIKWPDVPG